MTLFTLLFVKVLVLLAWAALAPKSFLKAYAYMLEHGSKVWKTVTWIFLFPFKLLAVHALSLKDDKFTDEVEDLKEKISDE